MTELVLAERGPDVVLASLARAGTPIGILMRRWARQLHGLDLPHYAVSIVRARGIDRIALEYLAAHHDPSSVVFVDGWTGKGAIAKELTAALSAVAAAGGPVFSDDLAVLADPGHSVRTFGTRDDFLIASACLNSTVSGLVSRTVLNPKYLAAEGLSRREVLCRLAAGDVSGVLLDAVSAQFDGRRARRAGRGRLRWRRRTARVTFAGWAAVEQIRRAVRDRVGELRQTRGGGGDPGAAAPGAVEDPGPGGRPPRPCAPAAARAAARRARRGGARPGVFVRRPGPPRLRRRHRGGLTTLTHRVVATDLDRTLIYSRAAIDSVTPPGQVPPLRCVEMLDGREQSFMTVRRGPLADG